MSTQNSQPRLPGKPVQHMPPSQHWQGRRGYESFPPIEPQRLKLERVCEDSGEWPLLTGPQASVPTHISSTAQRLPKFVFAFLLAAIIYLALHALCAGAVFCVGYGLGNLVGRPRGVWREVMDLVFVGTTCIIANVSFFAVPMLAINWGAKSRSEALARAAGCVAGMFALALIVFETLATNSSCIGEYVAIVVLLILCSVPGLLIGYHKLRAGI